MLTSSFTGTTLKHHCNFIKERTPKRKEGCCAVILSWPQSWYRFVSLPVFTFLSHLFLIHIILLHFMHLCKLFFGNKVGLKINK